MEARQHASREDGCAAARMIYCACCGSGMYSTYSVNKERRYRYYVCYRSQQKLEGYCTSRAVAAPWVEEAVAESIRRVGVQPDWQLSPLKRTYQGVSTSKLVIRSDGGHENLADWFRANL